MSAGQSSTCGECGETIVTPAREIRKTTIFHSNEIPHWNSIVEAKSVGGIIDLDQHDDEIQKHYAERHPGLPVPERFW